MADSSELTQILQQLTTQQAQQARQLTLTKCQEETDAMLLPDLREVKNVVLNDHEERLRRLEEFMRRAS